MTKQEKEAEEYRQYRYVCGLKDPVTLNEIEEAYYQGMLKQKQQMMKNAITGQLENGEDYLRIKCLHTSCRPQDDGKLVKLIIIKEGKQ